jgi:hypothetical protein
MPPTLVPTAPKFDVRRPFYLSSLDEPLPAIEDLTGLVNTPTLDFLTTGIEAASDCNSITAVVGPPGVGKTVCSLIAALRTGRSVVGFTVEEKIEPLHTARLLLEAVTGEPADDMTGRAIRRALGRAMADFDGIVLVDETHNAHRHGMRTLRYAYLAGKGRVTFVLIGYDLAKALQHHPDVVTHITPTLEAERLTGDDLIPALRAFHPILQQTSDTVLREMNERTGSGLLRSWWHMANMAEKSFGVTGGIDRPTGQDIAALARRPALSGPVRP